MSEIVIDAKETCLVSVDLQKGIAGLDTKPHAAG